MKLISTEERLPEPGIAVLGYWPDGGKDPDDQYFIVYLIKPKKRAPYWVSDRQKCPGLVWPPHEITHWIDLPKLPTGKTGCSTCENDFGNCCHCGR